MEYAMPIENKMEHFIETLRYDTFEKAQKDINRMKRIVERYGSFTFRELLGELNPDREDIVSQELFAAGRDYEWVSVDDWKVVPVHPYIQDDIYYKISLNRPRKIRKFNSNEAITVRELYNLRKGDRIIVREFVTEDGHEVTPDTINSDKQRRILTWNISTGTGRHIPDYVEFVDLQPKYVIFKAHFESNMGESYNETVHLEDVRNGRISIKREEAYL